MSTPRISATRVTVSSSCDKVNPIDLDATVGGALFEHTLYAIPSKVEAIYFHERLRRARSPLQFQRMNRRYDEVQSRRARDG